jgi:hypothetical protein
MARVQQRVLAQGLLACLIILVSAAAANATPQIDAVYPALSYPKRDLVRITIEGRGFDVPDPTQYFALIGGNIITAKRLKASDPEPAEGAYLRLVNQREIVLGGLEGNKYSGPQTIALLENGSQSNDVGFQIPTAPIFTPALCAVPIFAIIIAILVFLAWRGSGKKIAGQNHSLLSAFLLDPDTNTYSLSKLQIYVWLSVFGFSWLYVLLVRVLVRSEMGLPNVPQNVAGMTFISVGTTVLATGVASLKGPKGAGDVQPGLYDLISSGGMVIAERCQFLLWTILGAVAILFIMFETDKMTLQQIPDIPQGLLYLMGISSFGYLGGKFARGSGPVVDSVVAQAVEMGDDHIITVDIIGRNLDTAPGIQIGDTHVTYDQVDDKGALLEAAAGKGGTPAPEKDATLQLIKNDSTSTDPSKAAQLRLVLKDNDKITALQNAMKDLKESPPILTVTNDDGQTASWPFNSTGHNVK